MITKAQQRKIDDICEKEIANYDPKKNEVTRIYQKHKKGKYHIETEATLSRPTIAHIISTQMINRDLKFSKALYYKKCFDDNTFYLETGQTINFNQFQKLNNGNHRLTGLLLSKKKNLHISLAINVESKVNLDAVDHGEKRSLKDNMGFVKHEKGFENYQVHDKEPQIVNMAFAHSVNKKYYGLGMSIDVDFCKFHLYEDNNLYMPLQKTLEIYDSIGLPKCVKNDKIYRPYWGVFYRAYNHFEDKDDMVRMTHLLMNKDVYPRNSHEKIMKDLRNYLQNAGDHWSSSGTIIMQRYTLTNDVVLRYLHRQRNNGVRLHRTPVNRENFPFANEID